MITGFLKHHCSCESKTQLFLKCIVILLGKCVFVLPKNRNTADCQSPLRWRAGSSPLEHEGLEKEKGRGVKLINKLKKINHDWRMTATESGRKKNREKNDLSRG